MLEKTSKDNQTNGIAATNKTDLVQGHCALLLLTCKCLTGPTLHDLQLFVEFEFVRSNLSRRELTVDGDDGAAKQLKNGL